MDTSSWGSTIVGTSTSVTSIVHLFVMFLLTADLNGESFMSERIWLLPGTGSLWKLAKYPAILSFASGGMPSVAGSISAALQFLYRTVMACAMGESLYPQSQQPLMCAMCDRNCETWCFSIWGKSISHASGSSGSNPRKEVPPSDATVSERSKQSSGFGPLQSYHISSCPSK